MFRIVKLNNAISNNFQYLQTSDVQRSLEFAVVTEEDKINFCGTEDEVIAFLYSSWKVQLNELNKAFDDLVYNNYRIAEFGINHKHVISL